MYIPLLLLLVCCAEIPQYKEFKPEIRKTESGIPYVSTGVGYDSRINLPPYSVRLVFATRSGAYLADIDLEITPASGGKPIKIHSQGPWLSVDLPPGKYGVKASTSKGHVLSQSFRVVGGRVSLVKLAWNISDEEI
jgi:hypothetical protein